MAFSLIIGNVYPDEFLLIRFDLILKLDLKDFTHLYKLCFLGTKMKLVIKIKLSVALGFYALRKRC